MIQRFLTDPTSASLARSLDANALRQRVTANNIANAETPGFIRSAVSFESQLRAALEENNPDQVIEDISTLQLRAIEDDSNPMRPDGNNVNMEQEISDLAKSGLSYRAATVLLDLKGSMLRTAITEGRR